MKRILKLLPAALAAFTLASCSSDDLNLGEAQELQYSPDKLFVQVGDEFNDVTRGGFMTTVSDYTLKSAMFFKTGDELKLYRNETKWQPEKWTATDFGQYKNATGVAVFAKDGVTSIGNEDAYGIYPYGAAQFGNEERTSIQFDLTGMRYVDYSAEAQNYTLNNGAVIDAETEATGNTKAYTAAFPLWGVKKAASEVMTMQHLAGILRVDFASIDNANMTDHQVRYIVIKSPNVISGKLGTADDLLNPTDAEKLNVNVSTLNAKAPKLKTKAFVGAATDLAAVPTTGGQEDIMVVKLTNEDPNHVMLFVPITPGNKGGDINVYVSAPVADDAATVDVSGIAPFVLDAALIAKENDQQVKAKEGKDLTEVQPGVFYRINDDASNRNTTAKTPFELTQAIIDADKHAYRDFTMYFDGTIEVKNEDTAPQNFVIDFSNVTPNYGGEAYELKHNITIYAKFQNKKVAKPAKLYINSVTGNKTLTINFTNVAGTDPKLNEIVVAEELNGKLVLTKGADAKLPNITNYSVNQLTLKNAGTDLLKTYGKMTIDNIYNVVSERVTTMTLCDAVEEVDIKGGLIEKINFDTDAPLTKDVLVQADGKTLIEGIDYTNNAQTEDANNKFTDKKNLILKSKWDGTKPTGNNQKTTITGATGITDAYATAFGLASYTGAADAYLLGEFDLAGSATQKWTSIALTKAFKGAQFIRADKAATSAGRVATGAATIKNLYGENGLFASWIPAAEAVISNITFDGTNTITKAAGTKLGMLVGEVSTVTAVGIIKNIKLNGTNNIQDATVGKNAACVGIGGVIGKTSGANELKLANVKVGSGTSVYGFKYIGGIIGEIAGKVIFGAQKKDGSADYFTSASAYAADNEYNQSEANLTTILVASAPASPNLPTKGQFFGGASVIASDGDITIIGQLNALSTARQSDNSSVEWGYYLADKNAEYWKWLAYLKYNEIGHTGYKTSTDAGNNIVTVDGDVKQIWMYTKPSNANTYGTKTILVPYVGTQAQYNAAIVANTYGLGKTMFLGYVIKPY